MSTIFIILTIAFAITSSITTFDKRLIQAKREGVLPSDQPMLPSWVSFIYWIHIGLIIAMFVLNWRYALVLIVIGFIFAVLPVWEMIGNIIMSPFKPKQKKKNKSDIAVEKFIRFTEGWRKITGFKNKSPFDKEFIGTEFDPFTKETREHLKEIEKQLEEEYNNLSPEDKAKFNIFQNKINNKGKN